MDFKFKLERQRIFQIKLYYLRNVFLNLIHANHKRKINRVNYVEIKVYANQKHYKMKR